MENLGIDSKLVIAQLVNFALFFYVFKRFIAKPFFAALDSEKKKDAERESLLKKLEIGDAEMAKREKESQQKAKLEAEGIIKAAKADAEKVKADLVANAHAESADIVAKAKEQAAAEKEGIYKEARQHVADLSTMLVQKALKEYLTDDAQKQVTQNILKGIPERITN